MLAFSRETDPVNLERIFKHKRHRFLSIPALQWSSPPTKANND